MANAEAFLAKAEESLASAEADLAAARYNSCARNSYYAAFQSAVAALIAEQIDPGPRWEHTFVNSRFSMLIYRRKLYEAELRGMLESLLRRRLEADYSERSTSQTVASRTLSNARRLLNAVRGRISDDR